MPYYAKERLDTGTLPLPVGVASRNQRYDIAPTGMPLYRRGYTTSKKRGMGCGGCGLGTTAHEAGEAIAAGDTYSGKGLSTKTLVLVLGAVALGFLLLKG